MIKTEEELNDLFDRYRNVERINKKFVFRCAYSQGVSDENSRIIEALKRLLRGDKDERLWVFPEHESAWSIVKHIILNNWRARRKKANKLKLKYTRNYNGPRNSNPR